MAARVRTMDKPEAEAEARIAYIMHEMEDLDAALDECLREFQRGIEIIRGASTSMAKLDVRVQRLSAAVTREFGIEPEQTH